MKFLFYIVFLSGNVFADCSLFESNYNEYSNRRMIAYSDWQTIENSYLSCSRNTDAQEKFRVLKERRLQTLRNFEKLGIKEEAGISLSEHFSKLGEKSIKPIKPNNPVVTYNNDLKTVDYPESKNCKEITLSNDAVNFSNTRNQDGIGWCYAYAASDLLSFKYNQRLSSISFSSRTHSLKDQFSDPRKQGADVREAIEDSYKRLKGFCLESSLKSTDVNFCRFKDINELLTFISLGAHEELSSCSESDIKSIFPDINISMIQNGLSVSERTFLEKLIDEHCRKNKLIRSEPKIKTFIAPYANSEQIKNVIDRELLKNNPVIWAFDVHKITGQSGSGDHAGMVMGKTFNPQTKKCEYLIRNSWGKSCPFEMDGKPSRCHEVNGRQTGYFYVTEEHLLSNSSGAYYAE